jgi:hypothetical protein
MLFKPTYSRLFFDADADGSGGAGNGEGDKGGDATKPKTVEFSDEQQSEVNKRIAAARRQAEADAKARFEKDATDRAEAERVEKERKDAEAAGEFDKVRTSIETERDTFKTRAETAEAKAGEYEKLITPIVTERLDRLKAASAEVAKGFPAEASVLDQLAWLDDPRTKALIAAQATTNDKFRSHVNTPNPNTNAKPSDDEARRAQARTYRDF